MKKLHFLLLVFSAIVAFAAADYYVNVHSSDVSAPPPTSMQEDPYPNYTQTFLESNPQLFNYHVDKRHRTSQLFEKFDLSSLSKVRIYRNHLVYSDTAEGEAAETKEPIIVYEIQGPPNQGGLTYLNLKLKMLDQTDATGQINEISQFGFNSFFFNDLNNPSAAFLLTQIKDHLFGFQYKKDNDPSYQDIKIMINTLMDTI